MKQIQKTKTLMRKSSQKLSAALFLHKLAARAKVCITLIRKSPQKLLTDPVLHNQELQQSMGVSEALCKVTLQLLTDNETKSEKKH